MGFKDTAFEFLHVHFRSCPVCGSFFGLVGPTCSVCWKKMLRANASDNPVVSQTMTVRSIWDWVRDENRPLSILLETLKQNSSPRDWDHLACHLSEAVLLSKPSYYPELFVPCPAKIHGTSDHADQLARALARYWRVSTLSPLRYYDSKRSQKEQSLRDRQGLRFQRDEKFSLSSIDGLRVVFVDDVITTGYTAMAAFHALGRPQHFEVWCIAHRRLAAKFRL